MKCAHKMICIIHFEKNINIYKHMMSKAKETVDNAMRENAEKGPMVFN